MERVEGEDWPESSVLFGNGEVYGVGAFALVAMGTSSMAPLDRSA